MPFSDKKTEQYYDSYSDVYANVWSEQMHTGYFDKKKSLEQACSDMTIHLAKMAGLKKGKKILTIGCGRGDADRLLVTKFQANVIGLDISRKQLEEAQRKSSARHLDDSITYLQGSMTSLPLVSESVDCVWVQESFFHCHQKQKAAHEFYRVLRSGGTVVLEDTVLNIPSAKKEVMEVFGKRVQINDIFTAEQYLKMFKSAGFELSEIEDATRDLLTTYELILDYIRKNREKIRRNIDKKYWKALDNDFDRPKTSKLVSEDKLGCALMVFKKP